MKTTHITEFLMPKYQFFGLYNSNQLIIQREYIFVYILVLLYLQNFKQFLNNLRYNYEILINFILQKF